jgi:hypothetical protein
MFCHTGPLVLGYITITMSLIMCVEPNVKILFSYMYVCEFLVLVYVSFFVANKSLNVKILLVLVHKVKIPKKICSFRADFPADFDFRD